MSRLSLHERPLAPSGIKGVKPRERMGRVWTLADIRSPGESQVPRSRRAFEITHEDTWSQEPCYANATEAYSQLPEWGDFCQDPGYDDYAQHFPDDVFNDLLYGEESQDIWGWDENQAWEEEKIVIVSPSSRRKKSRRRAR